MVDSYLTNNVGAGIAGAVFIGEVLDAMIMQTEFEDNHVQCGAKWNFCGGAAFQLSQGSSLLVKDCSFKQNSAHSGLGHGGAIYIRGGSELIVTSSSFANNSAAFGGANGAQDMSTLRIDPPWFDEFCGCAGHAFVYLHGWNPFSKAVDNHWGQHCYYEESKRKVGVSAYEFLPGRLISMDMEHYRPKQGTEFSNNSAFSGGAVMVAYSSLHISSMSIDRDIPCGCIGSPGNLTTRFEGNVAFTGGAITSFGYKAHTILMNVDIYNNTALGATPDNVAFMESVTNINYTNDIAQSESFKGGCGSGGGGGMCLSCGEARFDANTAEFGGGLYVTSDGTTCEDQDDCYTIPITRNVLTFPSPLQDTTSEILNWYMDGIRFFRTIRARLAFLNRYIFIPAFPGNQVHGYYGAHQLFDKHPADYYGYLEPGDNNTYTEWRNYTEEVDGSATLFTGNEAVGGAGGAIYMEQLATINITCDKLEASYNNHTYGGEGSNTGYSGFKPNMTTMYDALNPCRSWTGNAAKLGFADILGTSPAAMNISFSPKPYQHLTTSGSYQFTSGDDLPIQISLTDVWGRQFVPTVTSTKSVMSVTISAQAFEHTHKRSLQENTQKGTATTSMTLLLGEYDPVWDQGPRCVPCDVGYFRIDEDLKECKVCPEDATCVNDTSLQPNADNPIIVPDDGYFHSNPFSTQIYQCDEQRF
eukprot:gene1563-32944_t